MLQLLSETMARFVRNHPYICGIVSFSYRSCIEQCGCLERKKLNDEVFGSIFASVFGIYNGKNRGGESDMPTTDMAIHALNELRLNPEHCIDKFWQLLERFRAGLINQALTILGNQQDAEDVAQETLCKAFLDLHRLRDTAKLGVWLRSINRCRALDVYRQKQRAKEERLSTGQQNCLEIRPENLPTEEISSINADVVRAVDSLPDQFREAVVLRYWEKLSTEQIAVRLGIPSGTVRSRLCRADGMLARKLKLIVRTGGKKP